jgi:hypothetical protein
MLFDAPVNKVAVEAILQQHCMGGVGAIDSAPP